MPLLQRPHFRRRRLQAQHEHVALRIHRPEQLPLRVVYRAQPHVAARLAAGIEFRKALPEVRVKVWSAKDWKPNFSSPPLQFSPPSGLKWGEKPWWVAVVMVILGALVKMVERRREEKK